MEHVLLFNKVKNCSLLVIAMFLCTVVEAQINLTTKYFEGTSWAVSNKDSSFFKSDTIRIVKLPRRALDKTDDSINIAAYFDNNDFITIQFKRANELTLFTTKVDSWSIIRKKGIYVWTFSAGRQTLSFYFNGKLLAKYKPIIQSQEEVKSNYTGGAVKATMLIVLKRLL